MAYELFFDGFEGYPTDTTYATLNTYGYANIGTYLTIIGLGAGRWINTKAVGFYTWTGGIQYAALRRYITPSSYVVFGAAIRQGYSTGVMQIHFCKDDIVQANLTIPANGTLSLTVGGGGGASMSVKSIPNQIWQYIEMGIYCADIGSREVRVNGSSVGWFPYATADTNNDGLGVINNIRVYCTAGENSLMDDFYLTFGDELKWLGDSRADLLLLTANSSPQDWVPSSGNAWELLNAGTGYIESATDEATSLFEKASMPYIPVAIHGVSVTGYMKKSDAGHREACLLAQSDATLVEGNSLALSTDAMGFTTILLTDPDTGVDWGQPGVDALQVGVRVKE